MPLNLTAPLYEKVFKTLLTIAICYSPYRLFSQETTDSTNGLELKEVTVRAFEQNRRLKDIPAAVNYIGRSLLERFSPNSIVHAVNATPGVRMEERSPGSYRFNIRGSALRSPFGVRNVKVYFNDIPFTDPGGHTYLNQLGYYNFNSLEIIKGPGSSLYGAGTGGVMLINSLRENELPDAFAEYARGSYEMNNLYGSLTTGTKSFQSKTGFQHQENNGYREHSKLRRNVLSWSGNFQFDSMHQLRTTFLYGDLHYQTPGALTESEFDRDPKMSRPGNVAFPGAMQAGAAVQQKTFLAGASYSQHITSWLQSKSTFYGSFTQLHNPTIQNYGRSSEPHVGGRAVFKINRSVGSSLFIIDAGTEWQQGFTKFSIHDNKGGQADTLRMLNEVNTRQSLLFVQASWELKDWLLTLGVSNNQRNVDFRVFLPRPLPERNKQFDNTWTPRISLLKKFGQTTLYSSISKGFSPPTTEELFPTGGVINLDLEAESGINYDAGIRTSIGKLYMDVNAFMFALENTIVQRRTAGGGNFYINAGKTRQRGLESSFQYPLFTSNKMFERSILWMSHTWHWFRYRDFQQTLFDAATGSFKTFNFSGNPLPGIPEHTIASGIDVGLKNGLFSSLTYYYNDKIPVNDANTVYAGSFHLLGARLGYQKWILDKYRLKLVIGAENLLDEVYSLGNDINGFGGRYFNAAAGRNFYASFIFQWVRD